MINPFMVKKYAALIITAIIPVLSFYTVTTMVSFIWGLGALTVAMLICTIISNKLLDHPFRAMVEGKGVMLIDMTSTGILRPFILSFLPPYLKGKGPFGEDVEDIFDRETVWSIAPPEAKGVIQQKEGEDGKVQTGIFIDSDEDEFNKARFTMFHYPVVLYNSQIRSVLTKDLLSEMEKTSFAEHQVLYLNRKIEELDSKIRDFARHVVESLKPKDYKKYLMIGIIVLIIFGIAMLAMFGPAIWGSIQNTAGNLPTIGT